MGKTVQSVVVVVVDMARWEYDIQSVVVVVDMARWEYDVQSVVGVVFVVVDMARWGRVSKALLLT